MTNPNAPAFPAGSESVCADKRGLTKREYFAGLFMQGILSDCESMKAMVRSFPDHEECESRTAFSAISFADALIAELNKGEPK